MEDRYKHICFNCRVAFTKVADKAGPNYTCPRCKRPLVRQRYFQTPPQKDIKAWNAAFTKLRDELRKPLGMQPDGKTPIIRRPALLKALYNNRFGSDEPS